MKKHKTILFDGVCNLCNGSVTFVIQRDKKDLFRFAALQEEPGTSLLAKHHIDPSVVDSIVLIDGGKAYTKSTAALRVARHLGGLYPLLYGFMVVPKCIRNWVYDYVAKNRYTWYGKKESCMIPTPELRGKFL
ncbi:thiol-disulfide oxidoreductase DCC family protein [Marinirhabdus gelatinilytica]|uniref:Putative DCC family thiol-disulfide oxidoreductase YuxK n=1 Tax=Marinirhabdus gelatinilytica TaxID=1703343 RepID=A0A370Q9Z5_9FLAO|nr:thiol-disulfide oxidoreductase DCC family protein [Marinirhabdus gelatinilytica]RDK85187.1 putative DCC family thiol-disulfide oxidoreductase YuxK [Marinirhabdus gelatinilytica]